MHPISQPKSHAVKVTCPLHIYTHKYQNLQYSWMMFLLFLFIIVAVAVVVTRYFPVSCCWSTTKKSLNIGAMKMMTIDLHAVDATGTNTLTPIHLPAKPKVKISNDYCKSHERRQITREIAYKPSSKTYPFNSASIAIVVHIKFLKQMKMKEKEKEQNKICANKRKKRKRHNKTQTFDLLKWKI